MARVQAAHSCLRLGRADVVRMLLEEGLNLDEL